MSVLGNIHARVRQELLSYSMIVPGYNVYSNTSGKKVHVTHSCSHEQKRRKRLQQSYLHSVHGRIGATVDSVWRLPGHFGLAKNHAPFPPNVMWALGRMTTRVRQELLSYSVLVPGYTRYGNTRGIKGMNGWRGGFWWNDSRRINAIMNPFIVCHGASVLGKVFTRC